MKTKYEVWRPLEIDRGKIKNAPYNPRTIDDKAKEKLRRGIEKKGLVEPIVWNERTGNIVGGHQRLEQIDALEGHQNYIITVSAIDVDEKAEMELNVLLNNPSAQGDWDLEKLKTIFDTVEVEETGFDMAEVYKLFGNKPTAAPAKVLEELNKQLEEAKSVIEELDRENARRDDEDFFLVVVFKSHDERLKFTDSCGFEDNRYVDGRELDHFVFEAENGDEKVVRKGKKTSSK